MKLDDVTGAVLAGGRGTRLGGVRKAFLRDAHGETLLARTLRLFDASFAASVIVANEREHYEHLGRTIAADPIPDRGAPGGLLAALSAASTPWVFLCACDMPALDARVIAALARRRTAGLRAVVALVGGRAEPLHAFWATDSRGDVERALCEGRPSFRDLLATMPAALVPLAELEREVPEAAASFANVNEPGDLARFGLTLPAASHS